MSQLNGGEFLNEIFQNDPRLGTLLQRMIDGVNKTSQAVGVAPVGEIAPPSSPDSINVAAAGEMLHVSLTHNATLR